MMMKGGAGWRVQVEEGARNRPNRFNLHEGQHIIASNPMFDNLVFKVDKLCTSSTVM